MKEDEYHGHYYRMELKTNGDTFEISKSSSSTWAKITKKNPDGTSDSLDIRSKQMAEQIHFTLGQMLGKEE